MCSGRAVHVMVSEVDLQLPHKLLKPFIFFLLTVGFLLKQALAKRKALGFRICAILHTVGMCAYIRVHMSVAQVLKWNGLMEISTLMALAACRGNAVSPERLHLPSSLPACNRE